MTITQMRRVFVHTTDEFYYVVPIEMKEEFYHLLLKFFNDKTKENKDTFLNRFECYQSSKEPPALEVYMPNVGLYDERRDNKV